MSFDAPVGLCLDIDGTVYREGSAFVEAVLRLPGAPECALSGERDRLRRAIGTVGRYRGGWSTAVRWRVALRVVDAVRTVGGDRAAATALDGLKTLETGRRDPSQGPDSYGSEAAYERMRESLLSRYGEAIAGHDEAALRAGVRRILREIDPIDPGIPEALTDAARAGVDLALVTDMPEHVAEAFAAVVVDAPVRAVRGTRFEVDDGAFTGAFETIEKGEVVAELREQFGWTRTVAAGDTIRDLPMAATADEFLAVGGEGRLREALEEPFVLRDAATGESPATVVVPRDRPLGEALRFVLGLDG